ncbi:MAG: DUF4097 family beta strand repeat-containing protein [Acidobacteriota bacterium]
MNRKPGEDAPLLSRTAGVETRALRILLAAGVALLLAAAVSGEERGATASRTDRFEATLPAGAAVHVSNVNGDVLASPGRAFSAVVTTTVTASTRARAEEILGKTRIAQSRDGDEYRLATQWPGQGGRRGKDHRRDALNCRDCRIVSRYELIVPQGAAASLQTVNGTVRVRDLEGDLELHSVNGNVQISGARRSLKAQTVNGRVEAEAAALPAGASWELQTVNGAVGATLPKDAKFDWSASTMGGEIASTFALPANREDATAEVPPAAPDQPRPPRPTAHTRRVVVVNDGDDGEQIIDTRELAREIEESLRDVEVEIHDATRQTERAMRHMRVVLPDRRYHAVVGGGGATVRASTLNGNITLLAAGTKESEAKPLVAGRHAIVVTVPRVEVRVPDVTVRMPRVRVPNPELLVDAGEGDEESVVRGDISGNFLSTSNGSYRVGRVSGKVKILTHSGEIHIASAGDGADLKTYGGDIRIGPVHGDLKAQTFAGDIRAGEVTGSATVETSGGDIRIDRIAGSASARTAGGDIVLPAVGGSVRAETGGGEIRVGVVSRSVRGGIAIRNSGGDVLLTLPSDFQAEIELSVEGPADPEDVLIHSEFPGLAVTRSADSQHASGTLNGGGPRVTVRASSGGIRLRRGPASGS